MPDPLKWLGRGAGAVSGGMAIQLNVLTTGVKAEQVTVEAELADEDQD
jgi:hypothetical protein